MPKRTHIFDNKDEAADYIIVAVYYALARLGVKLETDEHTEIVETLFDNIKCYAGEMAELVRTGKFEGYKPYPVDVEMMREQVLEQTKMLKKLLVDDSEEEEEDDEE